MKKRLGQVESAFLRKESPRTPMHVGCLMTFRLPSKTPRHFFRDLVGYLRAEAFLAEPFGLRLAEGRLSGVAPAWVAAEPDMEFHLRHSALPRPGGERELGALVARLHSNPMDFDRPLWECHLIEGLAGRRFAIYFKVHHCASDGLGVMRLAKGWLTENPEELHGPGGQDMQGTRSREPEGLSRWLGRLLRAAGTRARGSGELAARLLVMSQGEGSTVRASLDTPRTLFNVPVTQQRRLATQRLELARFKAVANALDVSVNDVTLAVCAGAVRRHLEDHDALPARTLTASVPVGLPRSGAGGGSALAGFVCPLATDEPDPHKRIARIHAATRRSRDELLRLSDDALEQFSLIGLAPLIGGRISGRLTKMRPLFNFVIANVVLTRRRLYLRGAELEAMYPLSVLFDGYALNVSVTGYGEHVCIGFLGCRDAIPKLQNLAVYAGEALTELERAAGVD